MAAHCGCTRAHCVSYREPGAALAVQYSLSAHAVQCPLRKKKKKKKKKREEREKERVLPMAGVQFFFFAHTHTY